MEEERLLIYEYYNNYKELCMISEKLKKLYKKGRKPNFPEYVSEFIAREILNAKKGKTGDLVYKNKKIEVKCFASNGPTSFGPDESWDYIVLMDAIKDGIIDMFLYKISNTSLVWQNIKINKFETFMDQCQQKRRPRINFEQLISQLPTPDYIITVDIASALLGKIIQIEI